MRNNVRTDLSAVERVATYAAHLRFEDLPRATVARARQVVLDTLGGALAGYQKPRVQMMAEFAATVQGGDDATLIADGRRSSLEGAAWANANLAKHSLDDTHRICGHVAAELVPVALTLGEYLRAGGRRVIMAIAAGYEVFGAIQPVVKEPQRARGLDPKAQVGSMASAITAGIMMGLDAKKLGNALALAMDMASGTEQYVYDAGRCDHLLAGYGARNGLYAARLADFGFMGPPGALDGPYGYFHAFGDGYDPTYLNRIGELNTLAETSFRTYAGCRHVHSCVDATLDLLTQGRPDLDEIESIEIRSYKSAITPDFRINPNPQSVGQAAYSLPSTVAIVLGRGGFYREDLEAFDQPPFRRLWPLVKVGLAEDIEAAYPSKNGCVVKVTMEGGRQYEGRVDHARGEPENPFTNVELEEKFRRQVGDFLPPERIEQLIEMSWMLDEVEDVGELVELTVRPVPIMAGVEATVLA